MIVALFLLVVALAVALVVLTCAHARFMRDVLGKFQDNAELVPVMADTWRQDLSMALTRQTEAFFINLRSYLAAAQQERALLYRVLISRGAAEFGTLDRIHNTDPARQTAPVFRDEAAYLAFLTDDMRKMGYEADGITPERDPDVPLQPEGA